MRAHVDIALRWGDQDAYGHVNNVAYARFLEEARVRLFWLGAAREDTGLERHFDGTQPNGPKMLVASQHIEFTAVLEYSEQPITVETWVGRLGGSSIEVHYEIVQDISAGADAVPTRIVYARAITALVMVDGVTLRPVRLSSDARSSIAGWTDEPLGLGRR